MIESISQNTLRRLPQYLIVLKTMRSEGKETVSSRDIAEAMQLNAVLVRKDLALISSETGKPNQGRQLSHIIKEIENYLGYNTLNEAVIVGVGMLGRALLSYQGFKDYGIDIILGFDVHADTPYSVNKVPIYHSDKMIQLIKRLHVPIGIITVPKKVAQTVCDALVAAGVKAIWNFAPVQLDVPEDIYVHNENMAESLALIANTLRKGHVTQK
ncbi:MAG: redox-sensing transcriptional repressor Rex [Bacillota bacterium]